MYNCNTCVIHLLCVFFVVWKQISSNSMGVQSPGSARCVEASPKLTEGVVSGRCCAAPQTRGRLLTLRRWALCVAWLLENNFSISSPWQDDTFAAVLRLKKPQVLGAVTKHSCSAIKPVAYWHPGPERGGRPDALVGLPALLGRPSALPKDTPQACWLDVLRC